jgi:hypothetical protein
MIPMKLCNLAWARIITVEQIRELGDMQQLSVLFTNFCL